MFKKSTTNKQLGLCTTASSLMCKRESKQHEDEREWHMQFYHNVTCNIDEDVFRPLFDEKMGRPTKAIRQLVAMSILKEGAGFRMRRCTRTAATTCFGVLHLDFSILMISVLPFPHTTICVS